LIIGNRVASFVEIDSRDINKYKYVLRHVRLDRSLLFIKNATSTAHMKTRSNHRSLLCQNVPLASFRPIRLRVDVGHHRLLPSVSVDLLQTN